jgi:purine-binding chemotaxis protein CheW
LASSATISEPADLQSADAPADVALPALNLDGSGGQLLLFDLAGQVYACEVAPVREIVPFRKAARLPGAPPYVLGLINLRGTIVTVLDLVRRLGVSDAARTRGSVLLIESGAKVVGLAVDAMRDVHQASDALFEEPLASMPEGSAVRGVGQVAGQVVVLIDVEAIVRHALL